MKKLILAYLLLIVSMVVLAGCGGEYTGIHRNEDATVSSGGAVSGMAVSGEAVSGTAVEAEEKTTVKYENRNSTNLYTTTGEEYSTTIVQRSLDGKLVKKLKPKTRGAEIISMRYVDDEWMYYTRWNAETDPFVELWRAPIQKKEGCDDVKFEQEEKVLVSENGIFDYIYVADGCVYYAESSKVGMAQSGVCRIYDLKEKKQVKVPEGTSVLENCGSIWLGYCEGKMLLRKSAELSEDEKGGLYVLDTKSNELQMLEKDDAWWDPVVTDPVMNEKQAYYAAGDVIKTYRDGMEEPETYISEGQLKEAVRAAGLEADSIEINCLYLDDTTLYILAYEGEDESWQMMFSCDLKGKSELRFEKKLYERFEEEFCGGVFDNDIYFVDGRCLVYDWSSAYDVDGICFDLATGEEKGVTKKDAEYWWSYW